jgi:hypothetical protein
VCGGGGADKVSRDMDIFGRGMQMGEHFLESGCFYFFIFTCLLNFAILGFELGALGPFHQPFVVMGLR